MTRLKRVRRMAAPVILAIVMSSCAHIAGKTVARKDPPNILIADDGSMCIVSTDRFDKTEVGLKALCAWRGGRVPGRPPSTGN